MITSRLAVRSPAKIATKDLLITNITRPVKMRSGAQLHEPLVALGPRLPLFTTEIGTICRAARTADRNRRDRRDSGAAPIRRRSSWVHVSRWCSQVTAVFQSAKVPLGLCCQAHT